MAIPLLNELKSSVLEVVPLIKQLLKKRQNEELDTSKGVSFLDVKNHELLSYLINMTHLMHRKASGLSIQDSPDVDRLVEIRVVLEKMRPTEQKLKYQIDKLVRLGTGTEASENDPLRLKPNPANLASKLDEKAANESDENEASDKPEIYKPPRVVPVFYEGDMTVKQKQEKEAERRKKRAASSSDMRDLYQQHTDGPEEIRHTGSGRLREDRKVLERKEYEESNFIRKSLTKKQLHAEKRVRTSSGLNEITSFPDFGLFGAESKRDKVDGPAKRKSSSKGRKGLSKKRKFRK